jgi:hypothetical protein
MSAENPGKLVAAGNDGSFWKYDDGNSCFVIEPTKTAENITACSVMGLHTVLGTQNGSIYYSRVGSFENDFQKIEAATAGSKINDALLLQPQNGNADSHVAFFVNDNSQLIKLINISNVSTALPTTSIVDAATGNRLNGLGYYQTTNAKMLTLAGNNGCLKNSVVLPTNSSSAQIVSQGGSVIMPRINDINFSNSFAGVLGGNDGLLRYTNNGGDSWKYVMPALEQVGSSHLQSNYNGVSMSVLDNTKFFAVGELSSAGKMHSYTFTSPSSFSATNIPISPSPSPLNKISSNAVYSFAVGQSGTILKVNNTTNVVSPPINSGTNHHLNAISLLPSSDNQTAIIVGDEGTVLKLEIGSIGTSNFDYYSGNDVYTDLPNHNLSDVYYSSNSRVYIVGSDNLFLKSQYDPSLTGLFPNTFFKKEINSNANNNLNCVWYMGNSLAFAAGSFTNINQVHKVAYQITDEAGQYSSLFYYDKLGRLVVSQNAKQAAYSPPRWSYTRFDFLGRIIEVGEKEENTLSSEPKFASIFVNQSGAVSSNLSQINDIALNNWLANSGIKYEVTKTYYDQSPVSYFNQNNSMANLQNTRNRVASVTFESVDDNDVFTYASASHYSYDIHGNVKRLYQDNHRVGKYFETALEINDGMERKVIDYDYDLISGKVLKVSYLN